MQEDLEYLEQSAVQSAYAYRKSGDVLDALSDLPSEAFQGVPTSRLWDAMRSIVSSGQEITENGIRAHLYGKGHLGANAMYWESYRAMLGTATPQPIKPLVEEIFQRGTKAKLVELHKKALVELESPGTVPSDHAAMTSESLNSIALRGMASNTEDVWGEAMNDIAVEGKLSHGGMVQGSWSCSPTLNDVYPFPCGGVTVVAARTNVGKSLYAFTCVKHTIERGHNVVWVNLDMPKSVIISKLASCVSGVEQYEIQNGVKPENMAAVLNAMALLRDRVTILQFSAHTSWEKIRPAIIKAQRKTKAKCVCLDHFTQIGRESKYGGRDDSQWAHISTSIKNVAQSCGVTFLLLVQINRQGATGEPGLNELTSTGSLEQDALGVITLWPEEMGDTKEMTKKTDDLFGTSKASVTTSDKWKNVDTIRCRVAKSQIGQAGTIVNLQRLGPINRFIEIERNTQGW